MGIFNTVKEPNHSKKKLQEFEKKYGMPTVEFVKKYTNKEKINIELSKQNEWFHSYLIYINTK